MNQVEVNKPLGIAVAAIALLLVAAGAWLAFGRQGDSTRPAMTGIPAVAGPAAPPPDAGGMAAPGTAGPGGTAVAPAVIPR